MAQHWLILRTRVARVPPAPLPTPEHHSIACLRTRVSRPASATAKATDATRLVRSTTTTACCSASRLLPTAVRNHVNSIPEDEQEPRPSTGSSQTWGTARERRASLPTQQPARHRRRYVGFYQRITATAIFIYATAIFIYLPPCDKSPSPSSASTPYRVIPRQGTMSQQNAVRQSGM